MAMTDAKSPNNDRLSNLPDNLILSIISFLDATEAVRTCVLSKRWRGLWTYLHSLNFNSCFHDYRVDRGKNIRFMDMFFTLLRTSNIDSFRLSWDGGRTDPVVCRRWIHNAVMRNPCVVNICLHVSYPLEIPETLFACASIEEMELVFCFCPLTIRGLTSGKVFLPSLKKLTFCGIRLGDAFMTELAHGCPVLEEIVIRQCGLSGTMTVSFPVLKSLIMEWCTLGTTGRLRISAPSLLTLQITDLELGKIGLSNASSLVTACVSFPRTYDKIRHKFLSSLSNVASLELTGLLLNYASAESLKNELPKWRQFENLKSLYVGDELLRKNCNLIAWLIYLSPNLEMLALCSRESVEHRGTRKLVVPVQLNCRRFDLVIRRTRDDKAELQFAIQILQKLMAYWKFYTERIDAA